MNRQIIQRAIQIEDRKVVLFDRDCQNRVQVLRPHMKRLCGIFWRCEDRKVCRNLDRRCLKQRGIQAANIASNRCNIARLGLVMDCQDRFAKLQVQIHQQDLLAAGCKLMG